MSGYSEGGASRTSRILKLWNPLSLSAGSDVDWNYELLKNRASDLARNSPLGQAAITTSTRGVIGSGLKLFARPNHKALGISAEDARSWSEKTATEFKMWASTTDCDLNRRNNFFDLQHIAYSSYLTDGDVFCLFRRKVPTPRNPYTLRLQLLEAARISTPTDGGIYTSNHVEGKAANGNRIVNGIEVDRDGQLVAVYVSNRVPNDLIGRDEITTWARVQAFGSKSGMPNILQVSHDERAGQYRGIPYLAAIIETLKQISRYTNAELSSAIVRTFFSLFFVQPLQNYGIDNVLGKQAEPDINLDEYKLGAGTLNALPRGVDVKSVDSGSSTTAFKDFVGALVTQIGAALSIPKEVLTCSFNASYSASRAALLQFNDEVQRRREWFIRDFCRPVYEAWLTEAVAIGRVQATGYFDDPVRRMAWSEASWYGPSMSTRDPLKEMQAAMLRLEAGLSTREKEAAELTGTDYDTNMEQQRYEEGERDGRGLDQV